MFGEEAVPKLIKGDNLQININNKRVEINLNNLVG